MARLARCRAAGASGLVYQDLHARDAVAIAEVKLVPLSIGGRQHLHTLLSSASGRVGALGLLLGESRRTSAARQQAGCGGCVSLPTAAGRRG
jgi:hypothetical protein